MSIQKLKEAADKILTRLTAVTGRGEEATKQALILPMLEALGYDIWNPTEVCPEYEADFAAKKLGQKEKVDYAIFFSNIPKIYIEAKAYKVDLNGHQGQLARYFNATQTVSLGILTNGTEYRLYTDSVEPNIMDTEPFHVVNLEAADQGLDIFTRFQKSIFSPEAIRDFATELQYTTKIANFFRTELDVRDSDPSDTLVRWVMGSPGMFEGRLTANTVDRFRPIVKQALQKVIREIVRRSLAALDEGVSAPVSSTEVVTSTPSMSSTPTTSSTQTDSKDGGKIVTTEAELECFSIIKKQFENSALATEKVYDPAIRKDVSLEVSYRDTMYYFGVYLNKVSWWIARIVVENKKPWIGFDLDPSTVKSMIPPKYEILEGNTVAKLRVSINTHEDLHSLNQLIFMAFKNRVDQLKSGKNISE